MGQRTTGIYSALSAHWAYSSFQDAVGARNVRRFVATELLQAPAGRRLRLLDIGCGPADILEDLPDDIDYVGCDLSEQYIEAAQRRFGHRGRFFQGLAENLVLEGEKFDRILALGLLHHLDDPQATAMLRTASQALNPGGMLITFDGVFLPEQSIAARTLLRLDRGKHVRRQPEYLALAESVFGSGVTSVVRKDLLRVPYAHLFMQCRALTQSP
ncbi:MAG: class I SAM-dependent methyltransferase [Hyphomonadaceae bacterium]